MRRLLKCRVSWSAVHIRVDHDTTTTHDPWRRARDGERPEVDCMTDRLRWTAPVAAFVSIAAPAYAAPYMSVEEAQKHAFPNASFAEVQAGRVWKVQGGGAGGYFYYDHVVGKHLLIDYTVAVGADGRVRRVDILNYRESYGGEVHDHGWLAQFVGKSRQSDVRV